MSRDEGQLSRQPEPGAPDAGGVHWDRITDVVAAVDGVWALPILASMAAGASRPADIAAAVNTRRSTAPPSGGQGRRNGRPAAAGGRRAPALISFKVMIETLRRLADNGLVVRREAPGWPQEVHYLLTEAGLDKLSALASLAGPGTGWRPDLLREPGQQAAAAPQQPSLARVWNHTGGGRDNYAGDRAVNAEVLEALPSIRDTAALTRRFQAEAVQALVGEGVRQFLDIGTGLPAARSVHEVAQQLAPESRVVYVDNDPAVMAHSRALLRSSPEGACTYIEEDLREPGKILALATETLDFTKPVAVILLMVLHFISDDEDPWTIVRRLMSAAGSTGYLVVGHAASDIDPEASAEAARRYNAKSLVPVNLRSHEEVARFYADAGVTLLPPGLVSLSRWFSQRDDGVSVPAAVNGHVAVGRRAAPGKGARPS